ncbi:MAG: pilus (MSHA type) biogenesis protein MshL [Deltaproteobacteria bacterium]|nr:pilus (MSHA type) biogenesis protein MshL [Deltaproteobacteria bacterium]MBW1928418.1 pilus (MSHA type) biogenesis protein MshL [Deltaproteobacteria bacterium]MBW2023783.1 pilus (MSHA type) biogenesis protein MshL [Deltaproteobacteria bacterium]MBW2124346.1 pilus (MSHA type) biogenesis protein MshL [Deltaproteobacteria bacterium]
MKNKITLLVSIGVFFLAGCSMGPHSMREPKPPTAKVVPKNIKEESKSADKDRQALVDYFEKKALKELEVEPVMPKYDPLEDHIVSFSMIDEDLQLVLYSLAQSVGMNLIMDPSITKEKHLVTLNFQNVTAATVLRELLNTYDLYYEIDQNVIRIRPYQERFFKVNFLDTNLSVNFDVGGDVLGASENETVGGLSGNFKLSGTGANKSNAYDLLEQMIQKLLSPGGKYSLNRISGTLYVKDTPTVIAAVSRMVNHLKDVLARQVLIEARIIEVTLSDNYSYGIDWDLLRREVSGVTKLNEASWALGRGLVLSGVSRAFTIDVAIDALKTFGHTRIVSNPSIRSKNGKPAVISVGTSITYKKDVSVTTTTVGNENQSTTEVEVSTVFDGLILGVIPFIGEDGKITLLINPIKSDVDPDSIEPVPVSDRSTESISLPKVGIKEMSSTISLNSGDVVFLGGLIDRHKQKITKGVPFLSSIPLLGYFFKNESFRNETRELVIVLSVKTV